MRPKREHATNNRQTYMVTTETWGRRALFRAGPWVRLLMDTLYHYRGSAYLLHEFVIMPDHLQALITPLTSLEKAVQFIKGGFSYRAKKELGSNMEVWQKGFSDHRIRDAGDYAQHVEYIRQNPVSKHLVARAEDYLFSSAYPGFALDEPPQGLKPQVVDEAFGAPKGAPFQSQSDQSLGLQSQTSQDQAGQSRPAQNQTDQNNADQNVTEAAEVPAYRAFQGKIQSKTKSNTA